MATYQTRITKDKRRRVLATIRKRGFPVVCKTFPTKASAKAWAERVEVEMTSGSFYDRLEAERHTLGDAIDRYLETKIEHLSANERRNRRQQLEVWREFHGSESLIALTPAAITRTLEKLARRRAPSTVNRYRAALSGVLRAAAGPWQWLDDSPLRRVPPMREPKGRDRMLSREELEKLLRACRDSEDSRIEGIVRLALATGARQGELMGLRVADVDFERGAAILRNTKNGETRSVPFSSRAKEALIEQTRVAHFSGYVFGVDKTRPGTPPSFPKRVWGEVVEAAGIEDFRFHDLRHTAASYLAMSGASLVELAAFLGHKTLQMVKRYSHLTESHSAEVARRMADRFLDV